MHQRTHQSSRNSLIQAKKSQLPRLLTTQAQQNSQSLAPKEDSEDNAFEQDKFEAFGLQLKQENGAITPVEQERLGVLQAKMDDFWAQRSEKASRSGYNFANIPVQPQSLQQTTISPTPVEVERPNQTGLPDRLKSGIEFLSGLSIDDVKVHYNSSKPAQLNALAYTQGRNIHVAPGQEQHLPHEAWHLVQQEQGRVKPTMQLKEGVPVNDDKGLEHEADVMGAKALETASQFQGESQEQVSLERVSAPVQRTKVKYGEHRASRLHASRGVVQRLVQIHEAENIRTSIGPMTSPNYQQQLATAKQNFKNLALRELDAIDSNIRQRIQLSDGLKSIWQTGYFPIQNAQPDDFADASTIEDYRQGLNKALDLIKSKVKGKPQSLSLPNVRVGNEFTFTDDALKKFGQNFKPELRKNDHRQWKNSYNDALAKGPYAQALGRWQVAMATHGFAPEPGKDKYGYTKHRYRFSQIDWYYDVTMDDSCVEVITPPIEAGKLVEGEIALAMDQYLFGIAQQAGLSPDSEVGGGHINLDRATGIEDGGRTLLQFLRAFFADAHYWKKLDPDMKNAPFPDELGRLKQLETVLNKVETQIKEGTEVTSGALATNLIQEVFTENLANEPKVSSPHYQAINLEHYNNLNQSEQRLEIRRVPAQTSRLDLLNQLDRIFALMEGQQPPASPRFR